MHSYLIVDSTDCLNAREFMRESNSVIYGVWACCGAVDTTNSFILYPRTGPRSGCGVQICDVEVYPGYQQMV